jgi:hypothetical protein
MLREATSRRLDERDGVGVESQNFRRQVKRDPNSLASVVPHHSTSLRGTSRPQDMNHRRRRANER